MKGLILAAGEGKRLRPLTETIPKALIPIAGKPLITYQLLKFKRAGIKDIGVVIKQKDYSRFKSTLKNLDLKIKYIFQKTPKGTLAATGCANDFVENKRFLLCWCDFFSPFDFRKLIREHLRFKPTATILINKQRDASSTSRVVFKGPYITHIVEKPKRSFSLWGSTGLLAFEPEIFSVLHKIGPSAEGEYHLPDALQYLIDQGRRVRFVKIDTWRINVNTLEDLSKARAKILKYLNSPAPFPFNSIGYLKF